MAVGCRPQKAKFEVVARAFQTVEGRARPCYSPGLPYRQGRADYSGKRGLCSGGAEKGWKMTISTVLGYLVSFLLAWVLT